MLAVLIAQQLSAPQAVSPITVALIAACGTLAGALVGGVLTPSMTLWIEARRTKRAARIGARLIRLDLALAASHLQDAESGHRWWAFQDTTIHSWDQYREALADHLDDEAWELVSQSVAELTRFTPGMRGAPGFATDAPFVALTAVAGQALRAMRVNATAAYNKLAEVAGGEVVDLLHEDQPAYQPSQATPRAGDHGRS